jgi:excisionase family DNA binding protein
MTSLKDVKQAAALLGISPWTVRAYVRDGKLIPVRIGRRVLLEEVELERFIADGKKPKDPRQPDPPQIGELL